ncbi:helix-turn-helix domain-containing protein [Paenibacillus sp. LHD-38]|uniref:response regulator transcription factor n=1 Tax=Paenibacillus sp. LHD-38 TaxID=3072143 RepID=UPI00280DFC40|nr:helix-turn-helix domain-containing protein [Paenibacillus sp. LHD-38]MDQ8735608.1 helix-turn-helix domain-containing protein [Paenibacillus sp. LHD-38]
MYTVMLVDDEKGITDGLKVIIPRYLPECQVIGCAYDGIDGVNMVRDLRPDIVITDIRMLRKDGLEMVQTLVNEGVDTKFIILSGYSEFEYARKGMHLGVRFYLNKPIEEEELQHCVRSIIREIDKEREKENTHGKEASLDISVEEDDSFLKKNVIVEIKQYIIANFEKNISLADLSNRFFINMHYLSQLFKEKTGQTYLEYLTQVRIERSKELLEKSELRIYEICQMVGYTDTTHFSKLFEKAVGCKPSEYKKMRK